MSKITSIKEITFKQGHDNCDGYEVSLDDGTSYKFVIDNFKRCCENWGYLSSDDNFDKYIGSHLLSVETVDTRLNVEKLKESEEVDYPLSERDLIFVNFNTSEGTLQFTVYNEHNGHYGHKVYLIKNNSVIENTYL